MWAHNYSPYQNTLRHPKSQAFSVRTCWYYLIHKEIGIFFFFYNEDCQIKNPLTSQWATEEVIWKILRVFFFFKAGMPGPKAPQTRPPGTSLSAHWVALKELHYFYPEIKKLTRPETLSQGNVSYFNTDVGNAGQYLGKGRGRLQKPLLLGRVHLHACRQSPSACM